MTKEKARALIIQIFNSYSNIITANYKDGVIQEAFEMAIEALRKTEQSLMVGEWELASDDDGEYGFCSICGNDADFTHYGKPYHYCPNCGAKMHLE